MVKKKRKKATKKKTLSSFAKATKKYNGKKLRTLTPRKSRKRVDPLWTLDDGVTHSILSKFLNDRHRTHISQVQGWKPKRLNLPLEFGNIFHHLVEAQDRGYSNEYMLKIAMNYAKKKCDERGNDEQTVKEYSFLSAIVDVTFRQYVEYWNNNPSLIVETGATEKAHYERNFHWVEKEASFDVDYQLSNGTKVRLKGKRDGLFQLQKSKKGLWLLETKTKGMIDETGITQGLHKDMQTGMYSVATQIEKKGILPDGVLYNVIRRTSLKPRVKDTPQIYAQRVEEDILKRPDFYFMRWSRTFDQDEIEFFKRHMLDPALHQIITWWNSIKRNPMNPFETPCKSCGGTGEIYTSGGMDNAPPPSLEQCESCIGVGIVPNLEHYERPFGHYDGMSHSQRGDFFEIITDDNYHNYEQQEHAFPELEEEDDLDFYLEGIE